MNTSEIRIAMWSGPRNISTALMRAWENRPDTMVRDEPLYGHYLDQTGTQHPGREETLAAYSKDWRTVVADTLGALPDSASILYEKQMAHHLLPNMERDWLGKITNCLLIRRPEDVITSLVKTFPAAELKHTGFPQLDEIYEFLVAAGTEPVIIDSRDVLLQPREMLTALCGKIGVNFDECMLQWPAGRRDSDGPWGPYWYDRVWESTGFAPYRDKNERVPDDYQSILATCQPIYDKLYDARLKLA